MDPVTTGGVFQDNIQDHVVSEVLRENSYFLQSEGTLHMVPSRSC